MTTHTLVYCPKHSRSWVKLLDDCEACPWCEVDCLQRSGEAIHQQLEDERDNARKAARTLWDRSRQIWAAKKWPWLEEE